MGSTQFGNFGNFCRDSTLPVCNLLTNSHDQTGGWGGCELTGIPLSGGRRLGNLGSILLCGIAIATAIYLILRSERKKAAVGRREMQLFLVGYIVISICEIFTVGEFPLSSTVRIAFTGIHIGFIIATTWMLMLNAVVGYQIHRRRYATVARPHPGICNRKFQSSYEGPNYRNIALYVLYQLAPLIFLVAFYVLETVLVLRVLGETRPMVYLTLAAVLFALGQIFNYAISPHICNGTDGKIDGALFQTLFTLLSVVMVWVFWSSITEDDWPMPASYP
ncbi:hypothetical protein INS49_011369 [Diaporthe citri]|uniref:uncharacterized protein n=1 Tax=Diaporthe citri TaxID=83186 RepID=UPI001C7E77B6|nr:uncharacterized protein INS49_011369 [Diaporthe citri]KAG6360312.1 hypothetical protein INS49_011369 [Diaporthe citri]